MSLIDYKKVNKIMEEAKELTTEQRKKLPDSAFCGPNRSFPVHDCAHYTAALRLLNRAKLSDEQKKKVKTCITKKGKKLGCVKDENKKEKSTYLTNEIKELCKTTMKETFELVEDTINNPEKYLDN